ncbi:unnamed protein product [Lathyrus sativus]|nr:unnamed protein product [Lathyrus sativus]
MIKITVEDHFKHRFTNLGGYRPILEGIHFSSLTEADSLDLEKDFSKEEIKGVIWDCDGDKNPSLDGFNLTFIKNYWDILGEEIIDVIQEFYNTTTLPKTFTASILALIPKIQNPQ